jgi:hypothetical protein
MLILPALRSSVPREVLQNGIGNERKITGWPLVAVWTLGIVGSWCAVIVAGFSLATFAQWLAGYL